MQSSLIDTRCIHTEYSLVFWAVYYVLRHLQSHLPARHPLRHSSPSLAVVDISCQSPHQPPRIQSHPLPSLARSPALSESASATSVHTLPTLPAPLPHRLSVQCCQQPNPAIVLETPTAVLAFVLVSKRHLVIINGHQLINRLGQLSDLGMCHTPPSPLLYCRDR